MRRAFRMHRENSTLARWHDLACRHCGAEFRHLVQRGRTPHFCAGCRVIWKAAQPPVGCPTCGATFRPGRPRGVAQVYCCRRCNPKYYKPCTDCGRLGDTGGYVAKGTGLYRCQSCRQAACPRGTSLCLHCDKPLAVRSQRKYCSITCANRATNAARSRQRPGSRTNRKQREAAAPGINYTERRKLLARWIRQGRACAYCPALATTMDHVIPLIRGGTNYEGNLAPCCKRCNSSKAGQLTTEWRTGRRCTGSYVMPTMRAAKPEPKPKPMRLCLVCDAEHQRTRRAKYCSGQCLAVANRAIARNRYRDAVGIPRSAPLHGRGEGPLLTLGDPHVLDTPDEREQFAPWVVNWMESRRSEGRVF